MEDGGELLWEPGPHGTARLRIASRLRPGWCGRLAAGLAERGIGITRGYAVAVATGHWRAELELAGAGNERLDRAQLRALFEVEHRAGFTTPIALESYQLARTETRGCLALGVVGRDELGFLAGLLRRLAYLALFPVELQLESFGTQVRDRLWLRGAGGRAPLPEVEKALARSLDALLDRSSPRPPERGRGTPLRLGPG